MSKIIYFIIAIIITIIPVSTSCLPGNNSETGNATSGHNYFTEDIPFGFQIVDTIHKPNSGNQTNYNLSGSQLKYTGQEISNESPNSQRQIYIYNFERMDTGSRVNLIIPTQAADNIKLIPEENYRLIYQYIPGWPTVYGLIIIQDTEIIFAGITEPSVNGQIKIDDSFFPILYPPIKIEQVKLLNDHYIEGGDFYERITNSEVTFSLNEKTGTLHQGESITLDNYKIHLSVARETKYKPGVFDAALNGLSYTISRIDGSASTYITAPANEIVFFPDKNLESLVRKAIGLPTGNITRLYLAGMQYLDASKQDITDLSGLDKCTGLNQLYLNENNITDISPLLNLKNLENLEISRNIINDISSLQQLTNLKSLNLSINKISDLSALSNLINLRKLLLWENQISDISPLSNLINLEELVLHGNQITDISPLNTLTKLEMLGLSRNQISDITNLSGMDHLGSLHLSWNNITDISPLASLTNLNTLILGSNNISEINPIRNLIKLQNVGLNDNRIVDISALANLTELYDPGLDNNMISDVSPLVENRGISRGDIVYLRNNPLNDKSLNVYIPQLEARGVNIYLK